MDSKAGAQINQKAFLQSFIIVFVLMMVAGILTVVIQPGRFDRVEQNGREVITPDSFRQIEAPAYPFWRWFTAPFEVLGTSDGVVVLMIIVFLLFVGGAFAVLDHSGILKAGIVRIVAGFGGRKYLLLLLISFFFMALGAFFGIFEEIVPLVPVMLALSYYLGWDSLVGLGMSILATNLGFSAAITNPFTIGIAQKIAGLPLFSGAWLRIIIFIVIYILFAVFLTRYAKKIERNPKKSLVYVEDQQGRQKYEAFNMVEFADPNPQFRAAVLWFLTCVVLVFAVLMAGPFVPVLTDLVLPVVGVLFLIAGVGAGLISGIGSRRVFASLWQGIVGIAPGIILILMAVSVKHIVVQGQVMDPILHAAANAFVRTGPFLSILMIYFLALFIEFFVGSGSAKAFLMMPILLPLADLVGVTRQLTVTAYCFGDGFSNLAYPTNPVLLIALGLTVVSYPKWIRWTLKLWLWVILATVGFLGFGILVGYGPF